MSDPYSVDPLWKSIAWAEKRGFLENRSNRALFRALSLGSDDAQIKAILQEGIHDLRVKEILGELDPFREPHLDDGEIFLGTSSLGRPIRIPLQAFSSGSLLIMPTGEGKSNVLRLILPQLNNQNVAVWVFQQAKRGHLAPYFPPGNKGIITLPFQEMKYDPMHPGDCPLPSHITNFSTGLTQGLGLGERSNAVVYQISDYLFEKYGNWQGRTDAYPNCFDLYEVVKTTSGILPAVKDSILDRMVPMLLGMRPWRLCWSPTEMSRHSICYDMAAAPESLKHIIPESLINTVFRAEIERGTVNAPLRLLVVFEDAQAYAQKALSGKMTPLEIAAGTVREGGLSVCICCQSMEGLSRGLVPNLTGLRLMRPGSNDDAWRLGSDMSLDREKIEHTQRRLEPWTYVVKTNQWPEAFIAHVPLAPIRRHVTDEEVEQSVKALDHLKTIPADEYKDWRPNYIIRVPSVSKKEDEPEKPFSTNREGSRAPVSRDELDYLESVATSLFMGATQRDQNLGISSWKGNKIRKQLLKKCLVSEAAVNPGGRGRKFLLLQLTENGEQLLKSYGIRVSNGRGRGSVEHQWWAWRIYKWLKKRGITSTIEDESLGARVDIAVETEQGMIAIEVETSRGHEIENISKDLEAGFSKVVSLLKDANQADKLRAKLMKQIPEKIPQVHVGNLTEYAEIFEELVCFGGA